MGVFKNEVGRPTNEVIKKRRILKLIIALLILIIIGLILYLIDDKYSVLNVVNTKSDNKLLKRENKILGNDISKFDLNFIQYNNKEENFVYSPLSIKKALLMLSEGTKGNSKTQIDYILGGYSNKETKNSQKVSIANALYIKDTHKDNLNKDYITNLKNNYNADVMTDSFKTPDNINSYISKKTFNLINNMFTDVSSYDFLLVNSLALDLRWKDKTIQASNSENSREGMYMVSFAHERYYESIEPIMDENYPTYKFNDKDEVKAVEIGATINNYDIVKELGENNIRKTVGDAYDKYVEEKKIQLDKYKSDPNTSLDIIKHAEEEYNDLLPKDKLLDKYIKEIDKNYKTCESSNDFRFYDDENVKMFAKDLEEVDDTNFEYIGIMPKKDDLTNYIKNVNTDKINDLINNLKTIELDNFEDKVITKITGYIPLFNFEYNLDVNKSLTKMGITDIFDSKKSNLSGILKNSKGYQMELAHKATIEFSNEGIKASAATAAGGYGDGGNEFDYIYEVPIKEINLTFDKPYMFILRNKKTNEVWFIGKVYEPTKYTMQRPN